MLRNLPAVFFFFPSSRLTGGPKADQTRCLQEGGPGCLQSELLGGRGGPESLLLKVGK